MLVASVDSTALWFSLMVEGKGRRKEKMVRPQTPSLADCIHSIWLMRNWLLLVVQSLKSFLTLWDPMDCSRSSVPVLHHLLELAQTHVHRASDANDRILCQPLLLLPSIFPSITVFSNQLALHIRWPGIYILILLFTVFASCWRNFSLCLMSQRCCSVLCLKTYSFVLHI